MKKVLTFLIVILFTVVSIKAEQTQTIDEKVKDNSNKYQEIQIPDRRGTNDFREATKGMKYDQPAIGVENGVYKDGTTGVTGIYTQDGLRYQIQINIGWKANGGPENATKMAKATTTAVANILNKYGQIYSVDKLNEMCDKYGDRDGNGVLDLNEAIDLVNLIASNYNVISDDYDWENSCINNWNKFGEDVIEAMNKELEKMYTEIEKGRDGRYKREIEINKNIEVKVYGKTKEDVIKRTRYVISRLKKK